MNSNNGNKKTNLIKNNGKSTTLSEGTVKKSFQPQVKPDLQGTTPTVNPKTIPKKK